MGEQSLTAVHKRDILIIEDSVATTTLFEDFLNELGYHNIHACTDAKTAMSEFSKLYNSNRLPLVFLDYYLPSTDTISLFKRLIKMEPKTKIIIATVAEKDEYGIKYLTQNGAYHYLQKPFSFKNIKEVIETFEKE